MTSENLFFKLTGRDIKRRIWCPVLLMIIYFLAMEVYTLITFQRIEMPNTWLESTCLQFFTNEFLSPDYNSLLVLTTVAAAALCGLSSFNYLNDRQQIDLYHSLPVHRTMLFFSRYLSGIICFVVPFALNLVVTLGIAAGRHAVNGSTFIQLFGFIGYHIVYFLSIYSLTIVAVMLTGNLILNVLGTAVLFFYSQIFWIAFSTMNMTFLDTFSSNFFEPYILLSPVHDVFVGMEKVGTLRNSTGILSYQPVCKNMLIEVFVIILFVVIAWFLYQKRPSEAAGKSMAFPISEKIIKPLFLLPSSLLCGIFFMQISSSNCDFAWFLFGSIFGFFLIGLIMEMIFRQDFKLLFCNIKCLLCCFVGLVIIVAVYKFDLIGYDSYLPKEDKIEYMAVSINNLDSNVTYYTDHNYMGTEKYRLQNMKLVDNTAAYQLAVEATTNKLVESNRYTGSDIVQEAVAVSDGSESAAQAAVNEDAAIKFTPISVRYHLKNGKDIYRDYYVNDAKSEVSQMLNALYDMPEYKNVNFPLLTGNQESYMRVNCTSMYHDYTIKLTDEMRQELLSIYCKELMGLTLEQIRTEYPIGDLNFITKNINMDRYSYGDTVSGYPVYPEFTETIAWFKQQGFDFYDNMDDINVTLLQVWDYSQNIVTEQGYTENAYVEYDDPQKMKELLANTACVFELYNTDFMPVDTAYEIDATYVSPDGNMYKNFIFKKDCVPNFVKEDIAAYVPDTNDDVY